MKKLILLGLAALTALTFWSCQGINAPDPSALDSALLTIHTPDVSLGSMIGSSAKASFKCTESWQIESSDTKATPDWFDVSPKSGNAGDIALTINATKNNDGNAVRMAYINVMVGSVVKQITVTQKASAIEYTEITIPTEGSLNDQLEGLDLASITALKLNGVMNAIDYVTVNTLPNLEVLNIENIETESIPSRALKGSIIKNITLPKNLVTIGKEAFNECQNLQSIHIPASVDTIEGSSGREVFSDCPRLASVTFEAGSKLKSLKGFSKCAITSIIIPANVETIDGIAFKECLKLASVTFEAGSKLKTIGTGYYYGEVFKNCSALTSITIPASVETISAFYGCEKLANITFEAGTQLKSLNGFNECAALTSIKIPASVETIDRAFDDCEKLASVTFEAGTKLKSLNGFGTLFIGDIGCAITSITVPASIETIGRNAFSGCTKLASVTFEAGSKLKSLGGFGRCAGGEVSINFDASNCALLETVEYSAFSKSKISIFKIGAVTPPTSGDAAFNGINSDAKLKVPASSIEAYKAVDGWKNFASITALDE